MTVVRVNPARNFKRSTSLFDSLFNELANFEKDRNHFVNKRPAANITENGEGFTIELVAPGLSKEDFKIDIDKDILTVSANKELKENEQEKVIKREFNFNKFKRTFRLPETIDTDKISANFENGVLIVSLLKKEEAIDKGPRTIAIK